MDQMQESVEKTAELTEEKLDAGGGFRPGCYSKCFFTPEESFSSVREDGFGTWAKCGSECEGILFCSCYNSNRCQNRWHKMTPQGGKHYPAPYNEMNHSDETKSYSKLLLKSCS